MALSSFLPDDKAIIHNMSLNEMTLSDAEQEKLLMAVFHYEEKQRAIEKLRKVRYQHGIQTIKTIYEKLLDLDHYYTSLKILQEIEIISNPISYKGFHSSMDELKSSVQTRSSVQLPNFLESNMYVSLGYSLVSAVFGEGSKNERKEHLSKAGCILEFTVQLQSDLKTIYSETEFLSGMNTHMLRDCEKLFHDYTTIVGFDSPLTDCRQQDQWEFLNDNIENHFRESTSHSDSKFDEKVFLSRSIDIDFGINRIAYFLERYDNFLTQSEQYYEKFDQILTRYVSNSTCELELPREYNEIKEDISISLDKFRNAYRLNELSGSKLKEMLYGEL
jgi:hypothetical protein